MTTWVTDANEESGSFTYSGNEKTADYSYARQGSIASWETKANELKGDFTYAGNEISGIYFLSSFGFIPYWDGNVDEWDALAYEYGD